MIFTVHGEHPDGDHSEFVRITAAGAVFKAADLLGNGYTRVHICDQNSQIFWPDTFDQLFVMRQSGA
jgi:hypothetical protein